MRLRLGMDWARHRYWHSRELDRSLGLNGIPRYARYTMVSGLSFRLDVVEIGLGDSRNPEGEKCDWIDLLDR